MNNTLATLRLELGKVLERIDATIPKGQSFGGAHQNWSFPGLTNEELSAEAKTLIDLIDAHEEKSDLGGQEVLLQDYVQRVRFLSDNTIPQIWGNANPGVSTYLLTLRGLRKALFASLGQDEYGRTSIKLRQLVTQVRSLEARLKDLEPRTSTLANMVSRIENAHEAAEQLPTDLASMAEAREKLDGLVTDATKHFGHIEEVRNNADALDESLRDSTRDAQSVLERCETAYSAATSVGLAAAFSERSTSLSKSMWIWVGGLVSALLAGSYFGSKQLHSLSQLFERTDVPTSVVVLNLMLSLLSVGAPVWFGWLATKQIGHRFRLAEDYAFKASISRAYEGFRREAARFDKDMEARLLASALTRLDELPLRLIEAETHGSPWHELASSDLVKDAVHIVPGFTSQVKDLAARAVNAVKSPKIKPAIKQEEQGPE